MREVAGPDLRVLPPTSLMGMAEVIRRAGLFIGGDTGPMHIASALGVPVLALFGPTDPALNAPWGPDHIVLDALASASPGRRPHDPSAFDSLSPGEIAAAALTCLASAAARGRQDSAVSGTPSAAPAARAH